MQTTIKLRDMFHYSLLPTIIFLILLLVCILTLLFLHIKKKQKTKPIEVHIAKDSNAIKIKYINLLNDLLNLLKNNKISKRHAYQKLSAYIRLFIYELTSVKIQNYTLTEIKSINLPIIYELVSKYYNPEFARISNGNILEDIVEAREVIERWK